MNSNGRAWAQLALLEMLAEMEITELDLQAIITRIGSDLQIAQSLANVADFAGSDVHIYSQALGLIGAIEDICTNG